MQPEIDLTRWFCIHAQPKREHIAAAALYQFGTVEVFCPRIRYRKATRRGAVWFIEALFPGYFFARFDFPSQHMAVRHALGVKTIVHFGSQTAILTDDIILGLRERCGSDPRDPIRPIIEIDPEPEIGEVVRVAEGAFQGLEAVVTRIMSGKERVRILIEFLGRQIEAEVGTDAIVPAAGRRARAKP
jgi:transcriptional antiterminator RfaH